MFEESDSAATKSPLHLAVSMRSVKRFISISLNNSLISVFEANVTVGLFWRRWEGM